MTALFAEKVLALKKAVDLVPPPKEKLCKLFLYAIANNSKKHFKSGQVSAYILSLATLYFLLALSSTVHI